jgi:hypothetical protein
MHPPGFTNNAGNPDRGERAAWLNNGPALVFRWSPLHVGSRAIYLDISVATQRLPF